MYLKKVADIKIFYGLRMKNIMIAFVLSLFLFTSGNSQVKNKKGNQTFTSGYSDVNGISMYYEMHGNSGEYLVLIHGGGSTIGTTFGTILPMLAKDFKVIAVELQGHGHTSDRNAPESFEQDADDVAALMKNLKIPRASIFGFSNGGNTAMQIAIRYPDIVNKLILASTFYKREGFPPGFYDGMKNATLNDMPQSLKKAFLDITPDSGKLLTMFNKDRERMVQFKDWSDEVVGSITAPTLIIAGDHDVVSSQHTIALSSVIKNSRLMIIPAMHGEYIGVAEIPNPNNKMPEMTVGIIKEFLKK